jgi:stalled ribosome rescue protein Dom34
MQCRIIFTSVIWIDHLQARVFHLGLSGLNEVVLHPHLLTRHIHHKANSIGSGHVHGSDVFLEQVLNAVKDAGEMLILGPSVAKVELAKYIREHNPQVDSRIAAVETADHPSDAEIVAYAKRHFKIGIPRATADQG